MKTFYSEYVRHCMRFYARHPQPKFRTEVDKLNWYACDNAIKGFSEKEQAILLTVYHLGDTIADNIYRISVECKLNQDVIWTLLDSLERKVAKKRGLI